MKKLLLSLASAASLASIAIAAGSMALAPEVPGASGEYLPFVGESVASGKQYALFADNGVAKPLTSGGATISTDAVTLEGDNFTASEDYALTITVVEGTNDRYTIQTADGSFYGADDNRGSQFTVSATAEGDSYQWTIEPESSKYKICNVQTKKYVVYDKGGYVFKLVADKGELEYPALYRFVGAEKAADIAAFIALSENPDKPKVVLEGATTAVYQSGEELWINDASGFLYVKGNVGQTYKNGDIIAAGISGRSVNDNGLYEMTQPAGFTAGTEGTPVEPATVGTDAIVLSKVSSYVELKGVKIATSGSNFTATDAAGNATLVNHFGVEIKDADKADVVGLVGVNNGSAVVYPTAVTIITEAAPSVTGEGTRLSPYTVGDVRILKLDGQDYSDKWVSGYIVGYVSVADFKSWDENATFSAEGAVKNNVILGPTADCADASKCIFLSLPGDSKVAKAVNLADHPANLGKQLEVCGNIAINPTVEVPGISDPTEYHLEGEKEYSLDMLQANAAMWTDKTGSSLKSSATPLFEQWYWNSDLSALVCTAKYNDAPKETSDIWAISPIIVLTKAKEAYVSFDHAAINQKNIKNYGGFYVRDFDGDSKWTKLDIPTWPEATGNPNNWVYANSGMIDLKDWLGKRVQVGFKYGSDEFAADEWRIKNLSFTGDESIVAEKSTTSSYSVSSVAAFNARALASTLTPYPQVTLDCRTYAIYSNKDRNGQYYTWLTDKNATMVVVGHFAGLDSDVPCQYYQNGHVVAAGITGAARNISNGQPEMTSPLSNFPTATDHVSALIEPRKFNTISAMRSSSSNNEYVLINNVSIAKDSKYAYTITDSEGATMSVDHLFLTTAASYMDSIRVSTGRGLCVEGFLMVEDGKTKIVPIKTTTPFRVETVQSPEFSMASGKLFKGTRVAITCPTPQAQIYYSTDPTKEFVEYKQPFTIDKETTIYAFATRNEFAQSQVVMAHYTAEAMPDNENVHPVVYDFTKPDKLTPKLNENWLKEDGDRKYYNVVDFSFIEGATEFTGSNNGGTEPRLYVDGNNSYFITYPQGKITIEVPRGYRILRVNFESKAATALSALKSTPEGYFENTWWAYADENIEKVEFSSSQATSISKCTVTYTYAIDEPEPETVATPTFSPKAGEVEEGTEVSIACATEGATIKYTINNDATELTYSKPIVINDSTTITAWAVKEGMTASKKATATYTVKKEVKPTSLTATYNFGDPTSLFPSYNKNYFTDTEGGKQAVVEGIPFQCNPGTDEETRFWSSSSKKNAVLFEQDGSYTYRFYSPANAYITVKEGYTIEKIEFVAPDEAALAGCTFTPGSYSHGMWTPGSSDEAISKVTISSDAADATILLKSITITYAPYVSGIGDLEADSADAPVEYYNLQGVRIENPESGLYIRRQGNKTTKVLIK